MALSGQQRRIVHLIVGIGNARHESRKRIVSALETGRVESNFTNPHGGDGTSQGWRQETASSYPNVNRRNVRAAVNRYYNEVNRVPTHGRTAGQVAQAVQRSAFPGRYDAARGEALQLYRGHAGDIAPGGVAGGVVQFGGGGAQQPVDPGGTQIADMLRAQLDTRQAPPVSAPAAPSFAAGPTFPVGYQAASAGAPAPRPDVSAAISAATSIPLGQVPQTVPASGSVVGVAGAQGQNGGGKTRVGRVVGRPLDRAGVRTRPRVVRFVQQVAGIYGRPIRLGTGTAHGQMTVSGHQSDHWTGHAVDLPARGAQLVAMGRAALIAAGMNPRRARRINGGGFNVNGHQIIFNTDAPGWGNHLDHLHVSAY